MRDHRADYAASGAVVLGISPDPVAKVKKFHDKYGTRTSPLLADEDHSVAESYGVWVQKSMYGKTYWGVQRSTFIVDADGKLAAILHKVKPGEHDALVLAALARYQSAGPRGPPGCAKRPQRLPANAEPEDIVTAPDRVLLTGSSSILGRPAGEKRMPSPSSTGSTYTRISSTRPRRRHWAATSAPRISRLLPPAAPQAVATASAISPLR